MQVSGAELRVDIFNEDGTLFRADVLLAEALGDDIDIAAYAAALNAVGFTIVGGGASVFTLFRVSPVMLSDKERSVLADALSFLDQDGDINENLKITENHWQTLCAKFGADVTARQAGVPANPHEATS